MAKKYILKPVSRSLERKRSHKPFLASDESSYTTGEIYGITGGSGIA